MLHMDQLEATIIQMIRTRPFYGALLNRMHIQYKDNLKEPAGITIKNGKVYLFIHKETFKEMSLSLRMGTIEHEINHIIDFHPIRRKARDSEIWSYACDLAVNSYIPDTPPNQILPDNIKFPKDLAAEEYYVKLEDKAAEFQLTLSQFSKHLKGKFSLGIEAVDLHESWNDPEADEEELAKSVIIDILRDAFNKNVGTLPGNARRRIEELLKNQVDWKQVLRSIVATARTSKKLSTWKRPNRRGFDNVPGKKKERTLKIALIVDTSMSTTGFLAEFKAEMLSIKQTGAKIEVMEVDRKIQRIYSFDHSFDPDFKGGGGTSLIPAFEHYQENKHFIPNILIYLTDGHGDAPKQMKIPTLWVITPEGKKPVNWGQMIRLPQRKI